MRVTRSFSFDDEKDAELLQFLDGCRNSSDSVRGLLRKALGISEEHLAINPDAYRSDLRQISEQPRQKLTYATETPSKGVTRPSNSKIEGLDSVFAAMTRIQPK